MSNIFDYGSVRSQIGGMFAATELAQVVRTRRSDMGLTQAALSRLSGLSRATVNQVENGTVKDLSMTRTARLLEVLGLTLSISPARPRHRSVSNPTPALVQAARSASVSYRAELPEQALQAVLLTGKVPRPYAPHVHAFLEDASPALLAAVVEQLHEQNGTARADVWARMRAIAQELGSRRDLWQ
jgi:transcriptional regulator with XRE-family HTH domain